MVEDHPGRPMQLGLVGHRTDPGQLVEVHMDKGESAPDIFAQVIGRCPRANIDQEGCQALLWGTRNGGITRRGKPPGRLGV